MSLALPALCAVDGGGTKTLAVVLDRDGLELGRATAGPSNYLAGEAERVVTTVTSAVMEAAGSHALAALWVGLAGIDRPGAREAITQGLAPLASEVRLTNDAQLLFGAFPDQAGIVLIAGTGSIALGQDRFGTTARAGGWGYLIGDEGSGYDLGRRGIRAAAKAADGRGLQTALLPALLAHWNLEQPWQIIDLLYAQDKTAIADCARLVFDAAGAFDPVAMRLVQSGAAELATAAGAVEKVLDFHAIAVPLVLAGSLLVDQDGYRQMVLDRIAHQFDLGRVDVVDEPASVAARHLARMAGA